MFYYSICHTVTRFPLVGHMKYHVYMIYNSVVTPQLQERCSGDLQMS